METLGYAHLIEALKLRVRPLDRTAYLSSSVNRRTEAGDRMLFPKNVAFEESPLGHLEFALRHEAVRLDIIAEAYTKLEPAVLVARLRANPNGEYIRKLAFLWEWLGGASLDAGVEVKGHYVDLLPPEDYIVAGNPVRNRFYRVNDNTLGNPAFCPIVRKSLIPESPSLAELLGEATALIDAFLESGDLYSRAVKYLYLSETRGSFAIEKETPDASKEERFVQLLQRAGEQTSLSEDWLVELQNAVVRHDFAREASYRAKQNWLEDHAGRITYFPPQAEYLRDLMAGWEAFANDTAKAVDPLVKIACASFGFVYLHPFLDGNGRLHRFIIHQLLSRSGLMGREILIPVSAVIIRKLPEYLDVLTGFSRPTTALWQYSLPAPDVDPLINAAAPASAYRYWDASRETAFLHEAIMSTVREEIPREIGFLHGYDAAFAAIDRKFDLPQKDIASLIRMIFSNDMTLSKHRRKQYAYLPAEVLDGIEALVREAFAGNQEFLPKCPLPAEKGITPIPSPQGRGLG